MAINAKRWALARYELDRARVLVNALPADQTVQEREQLALLRKKFKARDTTAAKNAAQKKSVAKPTAKKATSKKATSKKDVSKKAAPRPEPASDLGDRFINRAALGYAPADEA
ncbi:hypothetical protein ACF07T_04240 [Streptomyces sp. NPDC015184]|uniref:hypothetical protein n=1 Tax=Streptomyces sp. NPDC015184 TaxID=3364946 RepID=UPI0036FE8F2B